MGVLPEILKGLSCPKPKRRSGNSFQPAIDVPRQNLISCVIAPSTKILYSFSDTSLNNSFHQVQLQIQTMWDFIAQHISSHTHHCESCCRFLRLSFTILSAMCPNTTNPRQDILSIFYIASTTILIPFYCQPCAPLPLQSHRIEPSAAFELKSIFTTHSFPLIF